MEGGCFALVGDAVVSDDDEGRAAEESNAI